jgi:phosphatidylserine/phosphatidylglycerophosphate/cardiolipin synthase-like enzyme
MPPDPFEALGSFLTAQEAAGIAALLAARAHISQALQQVAPPRRAEAKALIDAASLGRRDDADRAISVLRAVAGAKTSARMELIPVWTMPGHQADIGGLTSEFHREVTAARISVTCASYNFTTRSNMWTALREASDSPGMTVTVYVDSEKANADRIRAQIPKATVYRSGVFEGQPVVSHAKFIVIDHTLVLLTSANFSGPAERSNVELGLRILDPGLAHTIESTMASQHGSLYQLD